MKACPIYFHFRLKSCAFRIFNLFPLTDSQCIQTWRGRIGSREAKNDRNHQKVASSAPQWFTEGYALYNPISSSIGYISINRRVPWRVWDGHFERNFVCISRFSVCQLLGAVNGWWHLLWPFLDKRLLKCLCQWWIRPVWRLLCRRCHQRTSNVRNDQFQKPFQFYASHMR